MAGRQLIASWRPPKWKDGKVDDDKEVENRQSRDTDHRCALGQSQHIDIRGTMNFYRLISAALLLSSLSSCGEEGDLRFFRTTAPSLNFLTTVTGRLAERDKCVILVLGPKMISRSDELSASDPVAVPLFNEGFTIKRDARGFVITTPEGLELRDGDIVSGEGGPFPRKPLDPRSAPVVDPPDTSKCRGDPYQVNSLYRSDLQRVSQ